MSHPIPSLWPTAAPIYWRKPDYFSFKSLLPSNWFPDHTILGKALNSPLLDPAGAALDRKKDQATLAAQEEVIKQYNNALTESDNKIVQATTAAKNIAAQANANTEQAAKEEQNKKILLIAGLVILVAIGAFIIFKKKK